MVADPINANIDLLMKCTDIAPPGAMMIGHDSDSFLISVDNYGNHKLQDIFLLASDAIREKAKEFKAELKHIKQ